LKSVSPVPSRGQAAFTLIELLVVIAIIAIAVSAINKVTLGDWIWHFNRGWLDQRSAWHNFKGKSLVVMRFGDGHAVGYRFPTKPEADPYWSVTPSPTNEWW